ncbi:MAG: homoserine O-acetyltransferase [Acidimicrobiia bacterium]
MKHRVTIGGDFPLEGGGSLTDVTVEVRTWGRHRKNATLICHALTGDANADDWWSGLFGTGRVFDPANEFIVSMNVLGSCYGTTGPTFPDPDGRPYGPRFPKVTIRDIVEVQRHTLDELGVETLDLIIGGSMGGMQVLEWAALYPDRVGSIVPIGVGITQSPWAIALSEAQRHAIITDPEFQDGHYAAERQPSGGLATARMIAMVSYRSHAEFAHRFGRSEDADGFAAQSYLRYQGSRFVDRFDANTYLTLIDAMDSHDLGRGRGPAEAILRRIDTPGLVVGISTDALYPVSEVRELAAMLPRCRFAVLDSIYGHDSFLVDTDALNDLVMAFRAQPRRAVPIRRPAEPGHGASWA